MNQPQSAEFGAGDVTLSAQGIFETSSTLKYRLGEKIVVGAKIFRYVQASEALTAGNLCTAKPALDGEDTVTVAHPIGTNKVVHVASAVITLNQFAEGLLMVDEGTGAGDAYQIKTHPAISSGNAGVITLYDGLRTAWVIADTDILMVGPVWVVQESNIDQAELPMGIPLIDVESAYYFWIQRSGISPALMDEAFGSVVGQRLVTIGSSTAGSVEAWDGTGEPIVGQTILDANQSEDAKYQPIYLMLE